MTTYQYGAQSLQALLLKCNKIDACAPLLKTLLSQCPVGVNFHMRRNGSDLVFAYDYHYPTMLPHFFSSDDRKATFWSNHKTTLEKYISHGFNYDNTAKFELSAQQKDIVEQLRVIKNDYVKEEEKVQQQLCSKYRIQASTAPENSSANNEVERPTCSYIA